MRTAWVTVLRVCREVAYGASALRAPYGRREPAPPPYLPPTVFTMPAPSFSAHPPARRRTGGPTGPYEPRAGTAR